MTRDPQQDPMNTSNDGNAHRSLSTEHSSKGLAAEQEALWNGARGQAWAEGEALMDQMLAPLLERLIDRIDGAESVLDVGCGNGALTIELAQRFGSTRLTGIDLSAPMLTNARRRASGLDEVEFLQGDAQTFDFGTRRFDRIVSRFGCMFFADPVSAFANLAGVATAGAELVTVVWRGPEENPFMTAGSEAASFFVEAPPSRAATDPGPFSFADPDHLEGVLRDSGWTNVRQQNLDETCSFPACDLDHFVERIAPLGVELDSLDAETRSQVVNAARAAYRSFVTGEELRFGAACRIVEATIPGERP